MKYFLFLNLILILTIGTKNNLFAQGKGDTWCFGDSVTLHLQGNIFVNQTSSNLESIEASASISDENGNLVFYAGGYTSNTPGYIKAWNYLHQIIQNGDSIMGDGTVTNGLIILPFPNDTNKYYLFSRIITFGLNLSLYYSIIDMSLNGGMGAVSQKNVLLYNQHELCEKLSAVKHGDGIDWWLVTHQFSFTTDVDSFCVFLITSSGITGPITQSIGSLYNHNLPYSGFFGEIQFSNDGTKLVAVGDNIIDLFDFDRCSGLLSNYQNLAISNPAPPLNHYYGCSFSNEASKLYVSNWTLPNDIQINKLYQFNLLAPNIPASKTTIFTNTSSGVSLGQHQLARNNKIYIASNYGLSFPNNMFGTANMNLSVIDSPEVAGLGCNYLPYSLNLGGRRCYGGLPNIPNYNLGPTSPICYVGINEKESESEQLTIYPNPSSSAFTVIANSFTNSRFFLYDVLGQLLIEKPFNIQLQLSVPFLNKGMYLIEVRDNEGRRARAEIAKE